MSTINPTEDRVRLGTKIDNDDYHRLPGVTNSKLGDFLKDPRRYWHKHINPSYVAPMAKPEFDFGSAVHEIVLLGEASSIVKIPSDVLSKNGSRSGGAWKAFLAENTGKILLKPHEYDAVMRCVAAVRDDDLAARLLGGTGPAERMFEAHDHNLELTLRCKPDKLNAEMNIVVDLKTCEDSTPEKFCKSICNYGYYRQAAFYRRVLEMLGVPVHEFVFIAVSSGEPHTVDCYSLSEAFWQKGQAEVENGLMDLAERIRYDNWLPRNAGRILRLEPPNYFRYMGEYDS